MGIVDVDFEEIAEEIRGMSFDEALDVLSDVMLVVMENIKNVARKTGELQSRRREGEEQMKSIQKSLTRIDARKGVVRDILKGEIGLYDRVFAKAVGYVV